MNPIVSYEFPSFYGEHPYIGIILVPWNYSPCILVAASWCLSHTSPVTREYFMNMSMQNPYTVITGFINTSQQDMIKNQIVLGIKAILHPNPLIAFVLIKVIPKFQRTSFVDYQQLKFSATELVNDGCESIYWTLSCNHKEGPNNFFYEYKLKNQIPCPYDTCHHSNASTCLVSTKMDEIPKENDISATIICNDHLMGFAEFGHENSLSVLYYHKITDDVIAWIKHYI